MGLFKQRGRGCLLGGFLILVAATSLGVAPVAADNAPLSYAGESSTTISSTLTGSGATAPDTSASPTGHDVAARFQSFYDQSGGLPVFGYALSGPVYENNLFVQYFERQRFEYHPENKGTPYEVLLGRLGAEQVKTAP